MFREPKHGCTDGTWCLGFECHVWYVLKHGYMNWSWYLGIRLDVERTKKGSWITSKFSISPSIC